MCITRGFFSRQHAIQAGSQQSRRRDRSVAQCAGSTGIGFPRRSQSSRAPADVLRGKTGSVGAGLLQLSESLQHDAERHGRLSGKSGPQTGARLQRRDREHRSQREAPLAAAKKASYQRIFKKASFDAGWHFLTGEQDAISKLAAAVGFRYRWDEATHQFVHAAGIMIATPEGKLSRYFYGIQYSPTDVRLSLVEASKHRIGSPVDYVLLFCCPYDPMTGKYTVAIYNVLKLAGGVTILCLALLVFFSIRSSKKRKANRQEEMVQVRGSST